MPGPGRFWLIAAISCCVAGCATFGRRGPSAEKVAACRELSRQAADALHTGRADTAESLLRQAIKASSEDPEANRQLAEVLWQRSATGEALQHIEAAIRGRPNDVALLVRSGQMLLETGAREAALERAEQAIRLDPHDAAAWALRGRVFWQRNEPDRALADLARALDLAPQEPDVLWDLAVLYRQRGQSARCLATLHQLHDACRGGGEQPQHALLLEGQALMDLGRPQQAAESFLAAARRGPPHADVLYSLAHAQLGAGRLAEASAAAQQALAIDASHQASRQLLQYLADRPRPAEGQRY